MKTGKVEGVKEIPGGPYYHFGLANQLTSNFAKDPSLLEGNALHVQINIDGLPLFKSGNGTSWPVLGKLINPDSVKKPDLFVIGLFYGKEKPCKPFCVHSYMDEFISEVEKLKSNGLLLNGLLYSVELPSFVCDAPAR